MNYEVRTPSGIVNAVFSIESDAEEYAAMKGYTVHEINSDFCPSYTSWQKCDFSGFQQVEIEGIRYYQKGRM